MIDRPRVRLTVEPCSETQFSGPGAERASEFAGRWHRRQGLSRPRPFSLRVLEAPPQHVGLGSGTALGLSVAAALQAFYGLPGAEGEQRAAELAASVGRGRRSAIGAHGFVLGGLLAEAGRGADEALSPLQRRVAAPADWRFVLLLPDQPQGLSGPDEARAFEQLPATPAEVSRRLQQQACQELLPAAEQGQFDRFCDSLYQYGRQAGLCFESIQGGAYNGREIAKLVERVRALGYAGVGQSSWGPTVFVAACSQQHAEALVQRLRTSDGRDEPKLQIQIAGPCNQGAQVRR